MQAIKCELCGSSDIMKQDGFFQCQNCGTKYSLEEARKLIGVVKIDKSDDVENLLTLARRNYGDKNYIDSAKYYEMVLRDAPNNWEAVYYYAYCKAQTTDPGYPDEALKTIINGTATATRLVLENVEPDKQPNALKAILEENDPILKTKIREMRKNNDIGYMTAFKLIHDISDLYLNIEKQIKASNCNEPELIRSVQTTTYDIAKHYTDAYKWGERRELLNRLKAELGK